MRKKIKEEEELIAQEVLTYYINWKTETIQTFEKILADLVEVELYEECVLVRENIEFLRNLTIFEILDQNGDVLLPYTFSHFTEQTKNIFRKYYDLTEYE